MSAPTNNPNQPAPPEGVTDADQIAGGEERWTQCPLKDCKRNPDLLYEDFYLRDIRTNRLMCSACAVRVEIGYMAREEVKKADDRFYQGSYADNAIVFGVMFAGSLAVNAFMLAIGFWLLALFLGASVGASLAGLARRFTQGRVTRQMPYVAIGGIVAGALLAPTVYFLLRAGLVIFNPTLALNFSILISSVAMASGAWGILMRRI
ncbi:MAG: hypothetical protein ACFE0Q_12040 [Anaerolineae bacterium]